MCPHSRMLRDIAHAFRVLRRSPGYTVAAVLALALGIGANTAIFSMLHAVLVRSLPYPQADRLALIRLRLPKLAAEPINLTSGATFFFAEQSQTFEAFASYQLRSYDVADDGAPERVTGLRCSSTLGAITGAPVKVGRWFTGREDTEAQRVAVISYGLWQRRFAATPNILGKTVTLQRKPYRIIGVTGSGFQFPPSGSLGPADVFVPYSFDQEERAELFDNFDYFLLARIRAGVSESQAGDDVKRVTRALQEKVPAQYRELLVLEGTLQPFKNFVVGDTRPLLLLLMGAVGFVLLIAVVNVASLALSHIAGRQHELAIRAALGASRGRVIRQLMTESLLLATLAGAVGLLVASWSLHGLLAAMPEEMPRSGEIHMDWIALVFTFAVSTAAGLAAGLIPGWLTLRRDPEPLLRQGGRGLTRGPHRRLSSALIVAEFAIAFMLLAGAGLLIRSFVNASGATIGFQPDHALSFSLSVSDAGYRKAEQIRQFSRQLVERLQALPGVQAVGTASDLPLNTSWQRVFTQRAMVRDSKTLVAHAEISGDYFAAIGAHLWRGRLFTREDRTSTPEPVIINRTMAARYWGGEQALGQQIKFGSPEEDIPWSTIVGIVDDIKDRSVEAAAGPHSYSPSAHSGELNVAIRTSGSVSAVAASVRQIVRSLDPSLPVVKMVPLAELVDEKVASRRFRTGLLVLFAGVALGLALLGIYSAIRNSVAQRTAEIGLRMALGAERRTVVAMILSEAGRLIAVGIVVGLAGFLALSRILSSFLFGVSGYDSLTLAITTLMLAAAGVCACFMPARAASRLDPIVALRAE